MGQVLQFKRKEKPLDLHLQVLLELKRLLPQGLFTFYNIEDGKGIGVRFHDEEVQAVAVALPVPEDAIGDDEDDD